MMDVVMDQAIELADATGDYRALALMAGIRAQRLEMTSNDLAANFHDARATLALAAAERWELICDWALVMGEL
jgi:hypothetical protein